jgi:YhcH/YjgK/YiaL family protein
MPRKIATALFTFAAAAAMAAAPVKVIFDTDMATDYDDVGALAMLHAFADAGEAELLAVLSSVSVGPGVAAIEVVNAYYGRPDIPVGAVKVPGASFHTGTVYGILPKYAGKFRHANAADAPDALDVYRRVLSAQPDGSVVICAVGFFTNLKTILEREPDLVKAKVKKLVLMGCRGLKEKGVEWNSGARAGDPVAGKWVLDNWKGPIVVSDYEFGKDVHTGRAVAEKEFAWPNPVKDAFKNCLTPREKCTDTSYDRVKGHRSWDQTAVLAAVRGEDDPLFKTVRGRYEIPAVVNREGPNTWTEDPSGTHLRLLPARGNAAVEDVIDELMCRPPAKGPRENWKLTPGEQPTVFHVFGVKGWHHPEKTHPCLAKAFEFMSRPDLASLAPGRYEIDGDNCWAMIQESDLKPVTDGPAQFEFHRAYIDVQAPISGSETYGVITTPPAEAAKPFAAGTDYALFKAKCAYVTLHPGEFAVFFPGGGAHAPGLSSDGPRKLRKLVVKVKMNQ